MSSLTDIVFLLLIFFIILSTFVSPTGAEVELPESDTRTTKHPTIAVTIKPDLTYLIDSEITPKGSMESILRRKAEGGKKPQIILSVDKSVPVGETISFLSMCKKNEFGIVIKTQPPQKP